MRMVFLLPALIYSENPFCAFRHFSKMPAHKLNSPGMSLCYNQYHPIGLQTFSLPLHSGKLSVWKGSCDILLPKIQTPDRYPAPVFVFPLNLYGRMEATLPIKTPDRLFPQLPDPHQLHFHCMYNFFARLGVKHTKPVIKSSILGINDTTFFAYS